MATLGQLMLKEMLQTQGSQQTFSEASLPENIQYNTDTNNS